MSKPTMGKMTKEAADKIAQNILELWWIPADIRNRDGARDAISNIILKGVENEVPMCECGHPVACHFVGGCMVEIRTEENYFCPCTQEGSKSEYDLKLVYKLSKK